MGAYKFFFVATWSLLQCVHVFLFRHRAGCIVYTSFFVLFFPFSSRFKVVTVSFDSYCWLRKMVSEDSVDSAGSRTAHPFVNSQSAMDQPRYEKKTARPSIAISRPSTNPTTYQYHLPINRSIDQSIVQSSNQPVNRSLNQSIKHSQAINQASKTSTEQSTNQPINQPTKR